MLVNSKPKSQGNGQIRKTGNSLPLKRLAKHQIGLVNERFQRRNPQFHTYREGLHAITVPSLAISTGSNGNRPKRDRT